MPNRSTKHEYVTVTSEGLRYRSQIFPSLAALIRWFKEHFRDAIPGTPARTPMGMTSGSNPSMTPRIAGVDAAAIQRAAAGLPSSVFNSLSQVAGQTPFGTNTYNPIQVSLFFPDGPLVFELNFVMGCDDMGNFHT